MENRLMIAKVEGGLGWVGKMGKVGQEAQAFSYMK